MTDHTPRGPAHRAQDPLRLLVLPGDGIGPEIVDATVSVLERAGRAEGVRFAFETAEIGFPALRAHGTTFPETVLAAARQADGILLGPVQHNDYPPVAAGGKNPSGELRRNLDLFANIRPARTTDMAAARSRQPFDLIVVRENTEGFYADRSMFLGPGEFMPTADLALSVRKVTRQGSLRIAEEAFRLAAQRPRRKVTVVHKANVLRVSDGLFLECTRAVAKRYPDVTYDEKLVDAMAALLIRDASAFDVICTTNMFGDILSDEASELAGSLGLAASLNAGADYAMAQPQHGSAPDIAGEDRANPASMIGSAAMLLRWMASRRAAPALAAIADRLDAALGRALATPDWRTADLGGPLGTRAFAERVGALLSEAAA
jgi:3-isopropylmalate dehydrogenase